MRLGNICIGALSSCAIAALLGGCGGTQLPIGAPGVVGANAGSATQRGSLGSSATEVLYTSRVKAKCFGNSGGCNCLFHATGEASGPFRGTFTARGDWNATRNSPWKFWETFSITSNTTVVTGTISGQGAHPQMKGGCLTFGPHIMTYSSGSQSGKVRVRFRWHHTMIEDLQDLQQWKPPAPVVAVPHLH